MKNLGTDTRVGEQISYVKKNHGHFSIDTESNWVEHVNYNYKKLWELPELRLYAK